jgi:hypothetical protein
MTGNKAVIAMFHIFHQILIEQHVAVVGSIRQIIDCHYFFGIGSQAVFPPLIEGVVIHDHPIYWGITQSRDGFGRIGLLFGPEP